MPRPEPDHFFRFTWFFLRLLFSFRGIHLLQAPLNSQSYFLTWGWLNSIFWMKMARHASFNLFMSCVPTICSTRSYFARLNLFPVASTFSHICTFMRVNQGWPCFAWEQALHLLGAGWATAASFGQLFVFLIRAPLRMPEASERLSRMFRFS